MPIKKDPFVDGRMNQDGKKPLQAQKAYKNSQKRARRKRTKLELENLKAERKLTKAEKELARKEELIRLTEAAKTPAQQRKIALQTIAESGVEPFKELLNISKDKDTPLAIRVKILTDIAALQAPKPKSIDIQADIKSDMTVQVVSFADVSQRQLKAAQPEAPALPDEAYNEFISPEEVTQRNKQAVLDAVVADEIED